MPLFINQEEVERRLNHPDNLLVKHTSLGSGNHSQHANSGRTQGSQNYKTEIKALIGILAKTQGVKKTSGELGIAISQVSHYKNGKTQTGPGIKPDKELRKELRKQDEMTGAEIKALVSSRVKALVESITDDKVEDLSPEKAAKAAANLSSVHKNFSGNTLGSDAEQGKYVFFGVIQKQEEEYPVVEAEYTSD